MPETKAAICQLEWNGSGGEHRHIIATEVLKVHRQNYHLGTPRSITKNDLDEENVRARATGEILKTQTSHEEPHHHVKATFHIHKKHKHDHSEDEIDYIDKETNGIIAAKLYEE